MKFINDIDLSVASDVRGKEVQETGDTLELTMAVLLKKLFDLVVEYSPRQQVLNSFSVYAATAFENYNTYRDALFAINPNASTGGLEFPERFPLTPVQSTVVLTKELARSVPANRRRTNAAPIKTTEGEGPLETNIIKLEYESYVKNTNGTLLNYRWYDVHVRIGNDGVGTFLRYEDIAYG